MAGLLQEIRKRLTRPFRVDSRNGWVYVGFGKDLMSGDMGRIYWEKPQNQGIVFGAAGSGKSELVARKTYEDIMTGYQSFNIDPKGSVSWLEAFLKACYRRGVLYDREKGPIILALPYPEVSFKFNPLQGLTPHQIAFVVASGVPESKEPFWWQISYEITLVTSLGLKAKGMEQITFSDIYSYITVEGIEELQRKVISDTDVNSEYRDEAIKTLDKLTSYDPQFFPRVNASLRTYLTRLITGEAGRILDVRLKKNLLEERLERGELRFFAFLNAEAMKQTAYDVARLLLAWLLIYVGKKSGELKTIQPQLRINVDELTEVAFHEINKAVRLVRERNVSMFMLTQSPSGLASAFREKGREVVEDIMNSCDLRIFLRMNSREDGEYVAKLSPEIERPRAIVHKNSISITYQRDRLIDQFDLQSLKEGYGYAFLDGTVYYFYTPLHKDRLRVKVVWTDEPAKVKADVVVNMKDLSSNYLDVKGEEEILVVLMHDLKENWKVGKHYVFEDPGVEEFYRKTRDFIKIYREDYLKLLDFVQGLKNIASTVKSKSILSRVSLLDHSLRTALKAYEEVSNREDLTQEQKEVAVLSALVHDFGKAVVTKRNYTKEDHIVKTREVLIKLGISGEIIKAACEHHEKETSSEPAKIVRSADQKAREEERTLLKQEEGGVEIKADFIMSRIRSEVNRSRSAVFYDNHIYVEKSYLREILKSAGVEEVEDEKIETALGGQFVEGRLLNGRRIEGEFVFLRIPCADPKIAAEKLRSPYAKLRVELT